MATNVERATTAGLDVILRLRLSNCIQKMPVFKRFGVLYFATEFVYE